MLGLPGSYRGADTFHPVLKNSILRGGKYEPLACIWPEDCWKDDITLLPTARVASREDVSSQGESLLTVDTQPRVLLPGLLHRKENLKLCVLEHKPGFGLSIQERFKLFGLLLCHASRAQTD